jgi:hypothetical protein|eukprot:COSAG03_NODE_551_length_6981_cov_20.070038_10_plen_108_part_00
MPGLRRTRRATAAASTCAGFIGIMLLGPALAGAPSAGQMADTDSSAVTSLEVNASGGSKNGQITCFGDSWAAFACPTLSSTVAGEASAPKQGGEQRRSGFDGECMGE